MDYKWKTPISVIFQIAKEVGVFSKNMSALNSWRLAVQFFCAGIFFVSLSATFGSTRDTVVPNEFWFTSDVYQVDEDATNAVITVGFAPGNRSWQGSVDYSVRSGTATAGEDFIAVSGTLYFSGPGTPVPTINIPIINDELQEGDETVQISLSNSNAIIAQTNATLVIIEKPPSLKIAASGNGKISLTWPESFSNFVLEKSAQPTGNNWSLVSSVQNVSNGVCCVEEPPSVTPVFYRLRKSGSP